MKNYDEGEESKFLIYLDMNNLYGGAMMKNLPIRDFKWMSCKQLERWREIPCTLEVDLEYDNRLHDLHNDYPLAPERVIVEKVEKFIPNFRDKKKYVVHHSILKTYLDLGLKIKNIWRGVMYKESTWLRDYIVLNTELRKKAKNTFEKDLFKLMNNSIFGKTMENIRKRVNIKLTNDKEKAERYSCKINYKSSTIFDENLIAVNMRKKSIYFDKPLYVGQAVLDLSREDMYNFHYNYMIDKYGNDCKMLYTDTDSFIYLIKTDDFYADIEDDIEYYFDTSEICSDMINIKKCNKKVPGMMKDECGGRIMKSFIGLRPKLYSYKMDDYDENDEDNKDNLKKKCKGIKSCALKRITYNDFEDVLFGRVEGKYKNMNILKSDGHNIYSVCVNKLALSGNDDKRVMMEDGFGTYAYEHWRVL